MAFDLYNNEFTEHNALRSYPFANGTSRRPIIGADDFQIPNDFIVGASIAVTANATVVRPDCFFLQRLSLYPHGYTLTIGYRTVSSASTPFTDVFESYEDISVAKATLLVTDFENKMTVIPLIPLENDFYGIQGHITIGSVQNITSLLAGEWIFDLEAAQFDMDVIRYLPRCVSSIKVTNSDSSLQTVYGEVEFVAGTNVTLTQVYQGDITKIIIDVQQDTTPPASASAIYTINGIRPNNNGNFSVVSGSECLNIVDEPSQITIEETCAQPCCDCEELSKLTTSIENIATATSNIQRYQQALEQQLSLLESALGVTGVGETT
jgi:hypothetical protein